MTLIKDADFQATDASSEITPFLLEKGLLKKPTFTKVVKSRRKEPPQITFDRDNRVIAVVPQARYQDCRCLPSSPDLHSISSY